MRLTLFENKRKTEDKHPDYVLNIKDGEDWKSIGAAWKKESNKGTKMLSITIYEENLDVYMEQQEEWKKQKEQEQSINPDDIPF